MNTIENINIVSKKSCFASYSEEYLYKLSRLLKGRLLNPHEFKTAKQIAIIFEMEKNIKEILESKRADNN